MLADKTDIRMEIEKIKNKFDNQEKNMQIVLRYLDKLLEKQERPNPLRNIWDLYPIIFNLY